MCEWRLLDYEWGKNRFPRGRCTTSQLSGGIVDHPSASLVAPSPTSAVRNWLSYILCCPSGALEEETERGASGLSVAQGSSGLSKPRIPALDSIRTRFLSGTQFPHLLKGPMRTGMREWEILLVKILYAHINMEGPQNISV